MGKNKKLLIDVNSIVPYFAFGHVDGIGRTTLELVKYLDKVEEIPFEIELYSQNLHGIGVNNLETHFRCHHLYLPNRKWINKIISYLPIKELMTGYDIMHIPHNFEYVHSPERCIVTIHDAMFFSYPEVHLDHDFARENYPKMAKKSKAIITCSSYSKREISQYMDIEEDKIFVCPWGVDRSIFYPHEVESISLTQNRPFFLSVSCNVGRKNTISVVKAYASFAKQSPLHDLVLVWKNPSIEVLELIDKSGLTNKIHIISDISNQELSDLYASATATFFPSKYEGFGLPILESMASGTPVITCQNSSLPEVGGDVALYVEPEDIELMSNIMERFENNDLTKSALKDACIAQANKFSWEDCVRRTIDVYKKCLEI